MKRKYQWEEWFGRRRTVLVRGVHYHCSQSTMAQTVRNNASARGLHVRLLDTGTSLVIETRTEGDSASPHTDKAPVAG